MAVWLPSKGGGSLEGVAAHIKSRHASTAREPSQTALASFLAGQGKETEEEQRAWKISEQGGARVAWSNLGKRMEAAISREDGPQAYHLSSAAMHGR